VTSFRFDEKLRREIADRLGRFDESIAAASRACSAV